MSIEEKRREAFERYCRAEGFILLELEIVRGEYRASIVRHMWDCWSAALDSVEIVLPAPEESYGSMGEGMGDPWLSYDIDAVKDAIEACGLKVKV